jgi:phage repressor protein C with HTH and peptisase S24 domain
VEKQWASLALEARSLLACAPETMSREQLDRLETLGDALIHLIGHREFLRPSSATEDARDLIEKMARRAGRRGRTTSAASTTVLNAGERESLRDRILAGLHAEQLRVREVATLPYMRALSSSQPPTRALLRELEMLHQAVVIPDFAIAAGAGREVWDVECTASVDVPDDLPRAPYVALQVAGDSMEPLIHSGDMVLVRVEDKATPGTVVVARDPEHGYVVKEVGRLTAHGIELRSLNPAFPTMRVPHGAGAVLGTVVLRWSGR